MTRKDKIYNFILALFPFIIFFPMYFSGKLISWLDMPFYFMPFRELTSGLIRHGIMPFWNPYIYCGNPLMANMQSAVLYPLNIFYHVLPADTALRISTYLIFLVMAVFSYGFFRLYKISEEGSFTAAVIFCFGFYTTIKAVELAEINVMGWLPAALYFAKSYAVSGKFRDKILASMALALSLLGGHPQFFFYGYILFSSIFIYEVVLVKKGNGIKGLLDFALINIILLCVTMIQLAPTIRFILLSKRSIGGFNLTENAGGFMKLDHIISFIFPFLSNAFSINSIFLNWMGLIDIGVMPLLLLALGALSMEDRKLKNILLGLLVFSMFFAFIGNMWFYPDLYKKIGILSSIRYPSKIILIAYFVICFFSGIGFDLLFKAEPGKLKKITAAALCSGVLVLALYLFCDLFKDIIIKKYREIFDPSMNFERIYDAVQLYGRFLSRFLIYTFLFLISVLFIYLAAAKQYKNTFIKSAAVLFITAGVYIFNAISYDNCAAYSEYRSPAKQTRFLMNDPGMGSYRLLATQVANTFEHKVEYDSIEDLFYYNKDSMTPNTPMVFGIYNADGFDSLVIGGFAAMEKKLQEMSRPWESSAFSLLSVKYIAGKKAISGEHIKLASKGWSDLYENTNRLGMAFFVPSGNPRIYAEGNSAADKLFTDGFDPAKTIILDEKEKQYAEALPAEPGGPGQDTGIELSHPDVNSINVKINTKISGFVVITDNYYPGWKAFIDGKEIRVMKAYGTFKAVYTGMGSHEIRLHYAPQELLPAAAVSMVLLILLIAAALFMPVLI